jgi:hypothetical protein
MTNILTNQDSSLFWSECVSFLTNGVLLADVYDAYTQQFAILLTAIPNNFSHTTLDNYYYLKALFVQLAGTYLSAVQLAGQAVGAEAPWSEERRSVGPLPDALFVGQHSRTWRNLPRDS